MVVCYSDVHVNQAAKTRYGWTSGKCKSNQLRWKCFMILVVAGTASSQTEGWGRAEAGRQSRKVEDAINYQQTQHT